jgi:hypothetical protein
MSSFDRFLIGVLAGGIAAGRASAAHAFRADDCAGAQIGFDASLGAAWENAALQLKADLAVQRELDRCAVVTLVSAGTEVVVEVVLADGRSAVRRVREPAELSSTVEALLLLPPPPARHENDATRVTSASSPGASSLDPLQLAEKPPVVMHVELGIGAGARLLGSPVFWGAGPVFFAQVSVDDWIVGTEAHWDVFDAPVTIAVPSGFNMQSVGVGAAVGRSFKGSALRADVLLGPEIVVENEEANGAGEGLGGTSNDIRLHLITRWLAARSTKMRWFGALDADVSPARIRQPVQVDQGLPTSPSWSAGLSVGLLWEAL